VTCPGGWSDSLPAPLVGTPHQSGRAQIAPRRRKGNNTNHFFLGRL
jgi:hypothetical protein